jgi:hypothetical protein
MRTHWWLAVVLVVGMASLGALFNDGDPSRLDRALASPDPSPPDQPVKLVFIHHSCGENWLVDGNGGLGAALAANSYYVSDTNYGWGPDSIGDSTDIGHWWTWFRGPHSDRYTAALYAHSGQSSWPYERLDSDPGGESSIIMFKSCFPNSNLQGSPDDAPTTGSNPLRGEGSWSEHHTVANAKGIYNDILAYFATRQDKLFIVITAPPVMDSTWAANARAFNTWLVEDWLDGYPHSNVAVWDFYTVLTSNGGSWQTNDLGWDTGNHHRYRNGVIEHITDQGGNTAAYPDGGSDNHPSRAGNLKATGELVDMLNIAYNRWHASSGDTTPTPTDTPGVTHTPTPTVPATPTATPHTQPARTPARSVDGRAPRGGSSSADDPCAGTAPAATTDRSLLQPTSEAEPGVRIARRDPVLGSCRMRVSAAGVDTVNDDGSPCLVTPEPRVPAFNADGSRFLLYGTWGSWYLWDTDTKTPIRQLSLGEDPRWHPTDPNALFAFDGTAMVVHDLEAGTHTVVHDFAAELAGTSATQVWLRWNGRPSADGRWWALLASAGAWDPVALLVYDRVTDQVVHHLALDPERLVEFTAMDPTGEWIVVVLAGACPDGQPGTAEAPCGVMVLDRVAPTWRGLTAEVGGGDVGLTTDGEPAWVYHHAASNTLKMVDLASGQSTDLWAIDQSQDWTELVVSGAAFDRPGWAVISTFDATADSAAWHDDQVLAVELAAGGRTVRLAHHRSVVDWDADHSGWAIPRACPSRDLNRVLFVSNWGQVGVEHAETHMLWVPEAWFASGR